MNAGTVVVALRFHWISTADEQLRRVAELNEDPGIGARELWGYIDERLAARHPPVEPLANDAWARVRLPDGTVQRP